MSTAPTPWRLDEDGDIIAANQVLVAIIPSKEDRALLVAAPDLLRLLKEVTAPFSGDRSMSDWLDECRELIAKAEATP